MPNKLGEKVGEVFVLVNLHYELGKEALRELNEVDAGTSKIAVIRKLWALRTTFTDVTGITLRTVKSGASGSVICKILLSLSVAHISSMQ